MTLVRILVLPLLVVLILDDGSDWPALWLWMVLATSDLFDGWLARRQGATRSGAFLDPLADKFLVLGAMVAPVSRGATTLGDITGRITLLGLARDWCERRGRLRSRD